MFIYSFRISVEYGLLRVDPQGELAMEALTVELWRKKMGVLLCSKEKWNEKVAGKFVVDLLHGKKTDGKESEKNLKTWLAFERKLKKKNFERLLDGRNHD